MVALGVITFMRSKKLSLILLIALFTLVALRSNYYLGSVFKSEENISGYTRVAAWIANWGITRDHILFGTGPAGYAVYYMTYFPQSAMATHSNYIDILAQTGIVGTAMCLWFFAILVWNGYKLCKRLSRKGGYAEALANAAFAGTIACIVIMGFGDWVFPFAYTQTIAGFDYAVYNWIFMGMIVVISSITQNLSNENASQQESSLVKV
jgi:O-antigen ligase